MWRKPVGEGAKRVLTVIHFLIKRFPAVIWLFPGKQSNVWGKILGQDQFLLRWLENWGDEDGYFRRSLWLPLGLAAGAALYFSLDYEPGITIWLAIALFIIAGCWMLSRIPMRFAAMPQFLLLLFVWSSAGFAYSSIRTHLADPVLLQSGQDKVMVEGWLKEISLSNGRQRLLIDVHAISGLSGERLPERVRLSQAGATPFRPGRFLRCFASVNPPPEPALRQDYEFSRDAYFQNLGGVGFVYGKCRAGFLPGDHGLLTRIENQLNETRFEIATYVFNTAGRGGGIAAALLTGDRSYISEEDQETLRSTGLAHLLAISGLHMGLAATAFYFLIFRSLVLIEPLSRAFPVQKLAAGGALLAITAYLALSGASISAQRAYIMVSVGLVSLIFDRPAISFQTLGLALMIVVILSPSAVVMPGFQMSFAAAGALVQAFNIFGRTRPGSSIIPAMVWRNLFPIILTSIVAGLATMPFAVFHFGRVAVHGILVNFLVMPVFSILCVPLAVLSVIGMMFGVGEWPLRAFGASLELILTIASSFQRGDAIQTISLAKPFGVFSLVAAVCAIANFILIRRPSLLISLFLIMLSLGVWIRQPTFDLVVSPTGHLAHHGETGWGMRTLPGAGLKPLRFSALPNVSCRDGCELTVEQFDVLYTEAGLKVTDRRTATSETFKADRGFALSVQNGELKYTDLAYRKCRPWTRNPSVCDDQS